MSKLRGFLCWCFGALALVFLFAVPIVFLPLRGRGPLPTTTRGIIGMVLAEVVLAMPALLTLTCGMAWWTLSRQKASGRRWAIAASSVLLLQGLVVGIAELSVLKDGDQDLLFLTSILVFTCLLIGIAGQVAFIPGNALEQMPARAAKPPRVAGDGTSSAIDAFAWIVQFAGFIAAMRWWRLWSEGHGLPPIRYGLLSIAVALLCITLLHECGHALTGTALGMKLRAFIIGPFQWRIRDGRWRFQFLPGKAFATGGATALVPTNAEQSQWQQIAMIAAGPLANLCTGLIALQMVLVPASRPNGQACEFLTLFATMSLLAFAGNLIPFRGEHYSDGARIFQILAGGSLAEYDHLASVASSTLVSPLRPRDFDIEAILRIARVIPNGTQGFMLRLLAHSCFLDRGELNAASAALVEAESVLQHSQLTVPAALYTVFVFGNAYVRRDATAARLWWERMQAKKPTDFNVDYWRAKSALHWIEGNLDEANAAWEKSNELAQRLPNVGAYEFDRYCCALLRSAIDKQGLASGVAATGC